MYIDSHLHIYATEFDNDREEVLNRMSEAGVTRAIVPDIDTETRQKMLDIAAQYPDMLFPLIGLHPTSVNSEWQKEIKTIENILGTQKIYGIGECGIDLYWDKTFYKEQLRVFEHHLGMARDCNLPIVVHAREAMPDILKCIGNFPGVTGILHCYAGDEEQARQGIDMGFKLGIGGVVTYKKSNLPDIISAVGVNHIVLETDAPYLAPTPHRGKRNEGSYIPLIAQKIAEVVNQPVEYIAEVTTGNCEQLFKL
ncbi:MAG: TatD family hydrolase [Marinifilaceae bacterium]